MRHRVVEAVLRVQRRDHVGRQRLLARPRPAGDGVHERERDDRDREEDRDDPQQAADEVPGHVFLDRPGFAPCPLVRVMSRPGPCSADGGGGAGSRGGTRSAPPTDELGAEAPSAWRSRCSRRTGRR